MIAETRAGDIGDDLPRSLESEQAVLGSILLDRDAIIEVNGLLRPDDFAHDAHSVIYRVMVDLYEQRRPVDLVTVMEEVERRDLLQRAGGRGYLLSLVDVVPTALHVEHYAKIVERAAILRRLIFAGGQIMGLGRRDGIDADQAISEAEETLLAVAQRRSTSGFVPIGDILSNILERIDYVHANKGAIIGVPSGFIDLDKILGGLQRSDLVILGARPAHGKTALALGMCHNASIRYKQRVAVFSLEMSKEQLVQRLLCMQGRLDSGRLRSGLIDDDEWNRLIEAATVLSESKIFIDDSAGVTPGEMRNRARRLQAEQGLDLIVVDYLQLMQGRSSENRVQEISGISRALKVLARELNIPVMALSQVSRGVDARASHVPLLSDLRESGCLTADTPVYLPDEGVYRPIGGLAGLSGFRVLGVDPKTWRLAPAVVSKAFATGVKPVYRLTTR
ncbi:MAG: replicative DNA helicase, partial [Chloroflexota bacterium]